MRSMGVAPSPRFGAFSPAHQKAAEIPLNPRYTAPQQTKNI
jgi:hypothetical protein